jgi:hypothetical protein
VSKRAPCVNSLIYRSMWGWQASGWEPGGCGWLFPEMSTKPSFDFLPSAFQCLQILLIGTSLAGPGMLGRVDESFWEPRSQAECRHFSSQHQEMARPNWLRKGYIHKSCTDFWKCPQFYAWVSDILKHKMHWMNKAKFNKRELF